MEVCRNCGRKNPLEEANFCYYCGASLRPDGSAPAVSAVSAEESAPVSEKNAAETDYTRVKRPFTTMQWLCMLLLLLIPLYGWIAFLVIASVSAFGANATEERRSFAKALLLFLVIAAVVLTVFWFYIQSNPELLAEYNKMLGDMGITPAAGGQ